MESVSCLMNIEPLVGLNIIKFGASKEEALELFGQPEVIENADGEDGIRSENWAYKKLGLELNFDPDFNFILERIYVYSSEVSLNSFNPICLSEKQLLENYPALELEVKDGRFTDYVDNSNELLFFLRDNVVKRVDVLPNLQEYLQRFG